MSRIVDSPSWFPEYMVQEMMSMERKYKERGIIDEVSSREEIVQVVLEQIDTIKDEKITI